jgi:hypothetical protein
VGEGGGIKESESSYEEHFTLLPLLFTQLSSSCTVSDTVALAKKEEDSVHCAHYTYTHSNSRHRFRERQNGRHVGGFLARIHPAVHAKLSLATRGGFLARS